MNNKIISFLIVFLLYVKFGSLGLWFGLVVLFSGLFILITSFLLLNAYAPLFYSEKFIPFWKKITGAFPAGLENQTPEEAKKEARDYLALAAGTITIILLIYIVLTRIFN